MAGVSERFSIGARVFRAFAKYSYVVSTIRHIAKRGNVADRLQSMYDPTSPAWRDTDDALETLSAICSQHNIDLVVFLYTDLASDFSRAFRAAYAASFDRLDVPYHLFSDGIFAREYRNSLVDGHPNATGHQAMAEEIYTIIHERF